ncbi:hypothetical protein Q5M85_19260 [Paraclostridium bifermentans]|nr:hypothetical protein [Paraclostridium bifermentans]
MIKRKSVKSEISSAEKAISSASEKLSLSEIELNKQINVFNTSKDSAQQEINKAKDKLKEQEDEVGKLRSI